MSSDLEIAEKEKLKLKLELDSAVNTVKQLRDEIRPAINLRSDLERRFEESRYRLKCALANIHEYEEEISMLKSQECGLKARIKELEDIELQYQRDREYTTQLESQFASQVQIIDVLKQKAIQGPFFVQINIYATIFFSLFHNCNKLNFSI
ncbi:unnamed protein product [Dracunculus medinensis]|uniref:Uncharacterized protein n=1 Tax=Dracunculus medinensis TaxID=318479 RepID=A0A3P7Q226_DRAME|nr:unnamed protein product [Dracunculus medinensis]